MAPLLGYKTQATDTSIEIELLLVQRWRQFTLTQKAEIITGLNKGCRQLSLIGIKQQYPHTTPDFIRKEYIRRHLGEEYANLMTHYSTLKTEIMIGNPLILALEMAEILDNLGIAYLVGGSVASSLLGEPRATLDLDLIADLRLEQVPDFLEKVTSRFYVSEQAVLEAIDNESSFNLIDLETTEKVDIFILKNNPHCQQDMQRKQRLMITANPEQFLYFPTAEDIIIQKLVWYRLGFSQSDRQWRDILGVLKVQFDKLDLSYLQYWALELELSDLLTRSLMEAGYSF
jgi:hypothetical protein